MTIHPTFSVTLRPSFPVTLRLGQRPSIRWFCAVALGLLAGCNRAAPPTPSHAPAAAAPAPKVPASPAASPSSAAAPSPVVPPSPASAPAPTSLFVAGPRGVVELALDGTVRRQLSATVGTDPRRTPDGLLVRTPAGLLRISLSGQPEILVAKLPEAVTACASADGAPVRHVLADLAVQAADDFTVAPDGSSACLSLMDRNANMADVTVRLHVDLKTGGVHAGVAGCPGEPAACATVVLPNVPPATDAPFRIDGGRLLKREPSGSLTVISGLGSGDFREAAASPSGRWVVIEGNESEADYIHRDLLLLDRMHGRVHAIVPGRFPPPIAQGDLVSLGRIRVRTADATGESEVRWLPGDVLLVDRLLVLPGQRALAIDGDIAP